MNALSQHFQPPSYGDAVKGVMAFIERPSKDTTRVEFSVGKVRYRVPRNYILKMDNYKGQRPETLVKFTATFPGFEPVTDKTEQCLLHTREREPEGCIPVRFIVGIRGTELSDDDYFQNNLRRFPNKTPTIDANGFEVYKDGNGFLYRKKTAKHTLVFSCGLRDDVELIRTMGKGSCRVYNSPLSGDNGLTYTIRYERINDAEAIDNGVRVLVESFTIKGE